MRSKGNAPNAAQKRWMEQVRDLGSVISGGPAVIHHPVGVTGKHNKVHIGHWWLIPLTDEEHKALHNGVVPEPHEDRKTFEKWAFSVVVNQIGDIPPHDVQNAIMDYHR